MRADSRTNSSRAALAAASSCAVPRATSSMRATVSSACWICSRPCVSRAICASMFHTISFRRVASTTARSTVCFWVSSALALCDTCSASALSAASFSSVFSLSSCSRVNDCSFSCTPCTAWVAAAEWSRASRAPSRMPCSSWLSCDSDRRRPSSSPFSAATAPADCPTSAVAWRKRARCSSNFAVSSRNAATVAWASRARAFSSSTACRHCASAPSGAVSASDDCLASAT